MNEKNNYRLLFERNNIGLYRAMPAGRFLDCNVSFARILGYRSREEVLEQSMENIFFNEAEGKVFLDTLMERGQVINMKLQLRRKEGRAVWILANASLIPEGENDHRYIQGSIIDVTEIIGIKEKNVHAQRRLETLQRITTAIHSSLDPEIIFQQITRGTVYSLGYTTAFILVIDHTKEQLEIKAVTTERKILSRLNAILGTTLENFTFPADPELNDTSRLLARGRSVVTDSLAEIAYPILRKGLCNTIQRITKSRHYIVVPLQVEEELIGGFVVASPLDRVSPDEQKIIELLARSASIAIRNANLHLRTRRIDQELRESEVKYRNLFENAGDIIVTFNLKGEVTAINKACEEYGFKREEMVGKDMLPFISKRNWPKLRREVASIIKGNPVKGEIEINTPVGVKIAEYRSNPIKKGEKVVGLQMIMRDITDRKQAQQEREVYLKELKFITDTVISLSRIDDIDEMCQYLGDAVHSVNRAAYVVVSLYDPEAGGVRLRSTHGFAKIVSKVLKLLGNDPRTFTYHPEQMEAYRELYTSGVLEHVPEGIYTLTEEKFPKSLCNTAEKMLGVENIYTVGFALEDNPYGGIIILTPKGKEVQFRSALETLARHFGVMVQRKQTQQALQQSQERLDLAVKSARVGLWDQDFKEGVIVRNREWAEMLGYDPKEINSNIAAFFDLIHPDDLPRVEELNQRHESGELELLNVEHRMKTRQGDWKWILNIGKIVERDSEGKPARATGVHLDITERKLAEERYSSLVTNLPVGVFRSTPEGKVISANAAMAEIYGFDSVEDLLQVRADEYYAHNITREKMLSDLETQGFLIEYETQERRKDGVPIWVSTNYRAIRDSLGRIKYIDGVVIDITERKRAERELQQSEEKFRTLAENIPGVIYLCKNDKRWTMLYLNDLVEELTGYSKEDFLSDRISFVDLYHPDDKELIFTEVEKALSKKRPFHIIYRIKHKSGKWIWINEVGSGIYEKGEIKALEGFLIDITKRKHAEETLQKQYAFQQLRADLWKAASESSNSETELIREMLKKVGHGLDISRATFLRLNPVKNEYIVESQWYTQAAGPSVNRSISYRKSALLFGRKYAELPKDLVPGLAQYVTRKFKKDSIYNYLAVPYGDKNNPIGMFTFSECRRERQWSQLEIDTLLEIVNIISLKSKQIEALRAIRESEASLKEAQALGRIGSWEYDIKTRKITWSDQTYLLYERDPGLGPPTVEEEAAYYSPEQVRILRDYARRAIENGESFKYDLEVKLPSGKTVNCSATMKPVKDDKGDVIRLQGTVQDITERKRAEEALRSSENRYRTIFENTGVATVIIEADTTLSFVNRQFEYLSGCKKEEIEHKKSWTDYVVEEEREKMKAYHTKRRENPASAPNQYEFRFKDREGAVKNILMTIAMIPGTDKSVASLLDITDQLRLEKQLQQAQRLEAVGQLTGGVAHDFNNLLTVIQGNAELMSMQDDITHSQSTLLQEIMNASSRATRLTRQLLLFSRKEAMVFEPLNLNRTINELLKMLKRLIGEDVTIRTDLADDLWSIAGDEGNLEQVIMNLAVNARDAMPKGGEILLRTENIELSESEAQQIPDASAGRSVCFIFKDNGVGMDRALLDKIFDPFFSTKQVGKGTGLGLSVVYGIVKKHEGWINVYSEKDKGTAFKIYFPARSISVEEHEGEVVQWERLQGHGEWILLIEDDPDVRKFGKYILEENGYQIDDVGNAARALEQFIKRKGEYDLIISDVVLPDTDGLELIDRLHAFNSRVPVIMSSGYTEEMSKRTIIDARQYPFIEKPFEIEKLLAMVKQMLKKPRGDG